MSNTTTTTIPTSTILKTTGSIGGSMWNIKDATLELNPANYLQTELGVALRALQDKNTIKAIKTPEDFIRDRSLDIANLFYDNVNKVDGPVTQAFNTRYKELQALSIPEEVARDMAKKTAMRVYNEELEILELAAPDAYSKAFGIAGVEHNATIAKNEIAGGINEHDVIAKYKSYKRAKKASKK